MSHCTTFAFSYNDEELAVKCFRRLGLTPSTEVIADYSSQFSKLFLAKLGYAGVRQTRAIISESQGFQYFFCKVGSEYKLFLEKHGVITVDDQKTMTQMESDFRLTYIELALERLVERLEESGTPSRVVRENQSVILQFGSAYDRSVRLAIDKNGEILEEVHGVIGTSCSDLTAVVEELISTDDVELITVWKPEYHQKIDDEVLQVLRLHP